MDAYYYYIYTDRIWGTNEVPVPVPVPVMLDPYFYFLSRKNLLQSPGASASASAGARPRQNSLPGKGFTKGVVAPADTATVRGLSKNDA